MIEQLPRTSHVLLSRERLFFWLSLVASLNALAGLLIRASIQDGLGHSVFNLFGISAIVYLAIFAALAILLETNVTSIDFSDKAVAVFVFATAMLPMANASSVALTLLAIYAITTSAHRSPLGRAGVILLSVTMALIWGRLSLALLSRSLLSVDAFFITTFAGAEHIGNKVMFVEPSYGSFVIAPGCSSLQGMSLAFVFWMTVSQWYRLPFGLRSSLYCLGAVLATLGINVARLSTIAHFPEHFDKLHTGVGWVVASWLTFAAIFIIVALGARREIVAQN